MNTYAVPTRIDTECDMTAEYEALVLGGRRQVQAEFSYDAVEQGAVR